MAFQTNLAWAKIYKYKDENGKIHFTDDASAVPKKYRNQIEEKKFRGTGSAPVKDAPEGGSKDKNGDAGKEPGQEEDEGLSEKDLALIDKTIPLLKSGVALAKRYENVQPNAANGRGLVIAIQNRLSARKSLAKELSSSKAPVLQKVGGFLNKSVAADESTKGIGSGLKKVVAGIIGRVAAEGKEQIGLVKDLEDAKKEDKKKKEEAKKKKEEAEKDNKK